MATLQVTQRHRSGLPAGVDSAPEDRITDRYHVLRSPRLSRRTPRVFTAKAALTPRVSRKNLQSGRTHGRRFANEHVTSPNKGTRGRTGHMRQPGRGAPGIPRRCRAGRPAVSPARNLDQDGFNRRWRARMTWRVSAARAPCATFLPAPVRGSCPGIAGWRVVWAQDRSRPARVRSSSGIDSAARLASQRAGGLTASSAASAIRGS